MKTLLTVEQAAEFAQVKVVTVRSWHRKGQLPEACRMADGCGRHRVYFTMGAVESLCRATCPWCGSTFKRSNVRQVYCLPACRKEAHRMKKKGGSNE